MSDDTLAPGLVSDLLLAHLDQDDDAVDEVLTRAEEQGAAVVPDVLAAFAHARRLGDREATAVLSCAAEIAIAADVPEAWEVLFRDVAATTGGNVDAEMAALLEPVADRDWCDIAFPLRTAAIAEGDTALRRVAGYLLSFSEPGTPGVYEALLEDHRVDPGQGLGNLCAHGDERAAELLRAALMTPDDLLEIDREALWEASSVACALLDWDVALTIDERHCAEAAIVAQCAELENDNDDLREQIEHNSRIAADLRQRLPGRLRPARAPRRTGPNEPCPCGSGRKSKRCCG